MNSGWRGKPLRSISVTLCIALAIASIFAGAGTYTYFSGAAFIVDFSSPETIKPVMISGLCPGETVHIVIKVPNPHSAPITTKVRLLNVVCSENGVVKPEQEWYNLHGVRNDIDSVITFGLWIDRDGETSSCKIVAGDQWIIDEAEGRHIDDIVGVYHVLGIMNSGEILTVVTSYHMDEETENWAQSDIMTFDIEILLEEVVSPRSRRLDRTPPAISMVEVMDVRDRDATIRWTTDEFTTGYVEYGRTVSYGLTSDMTSMGKSQTVTLVGLAGLRN
jgi:hypothetical protein